MTRLSARRAAAAAVPLLTLPVIMLAATPGAAFASAPSASIQFVNQAQLQPDGSIVVTVNASCLPSVLGPTGNVVVEADQVAEAGANQVNFTCDGKKHMLTVDVVPEIGTGSFTRGTVAAFGLVENALGVAFAQTIPTVALKVR